MNIPSLMRIHKVWKCRLQPFNDRKSQ